jgi:hypothetical protein
MHTQSRIPQLRDTTFDSALLWFSEMSCRALLFHPEDDPGDIVRIADGQPLFSENEVAEIRFLVDEIEAELGHEQMIEAAYPAFMKAFGIQLDA